MIFSFIMYYTKLFLQSIVVFVSLGFAISKTTSLGNNRKIFSAELDIVRPWEECKALNETHSLCADDLFAENAELANLDNYRYIMKLKIGSNKQEFRVS